MVASASLGMALRLSPPCMLAIRRSMPWLIASLRKRPISWFALALGLWMSSPLCPPLSPETFIFTAKGLYGTLSFSISSQSSVSIPPAQPIIISSSSSESRFIMVPDSSSPALSPMAPLSPTSSDTVSRASSGRSMVLSAIRAIIIATPMPSSPPSVVPLALTVSPLTIISNGSFVKSCPTLEFFSHTMSMWAWKSNILPFLVSPALRRIRLPAPSTL